MAHETVISLPHLPGVYVFKDAVGTILYIGKAKDLKRRVSSYFQKMKEDAKIARLIEAHETIGFIVTRNALEALLLEAHLIQLYQPEFNVLLKTSSKTRIIVALSMFLSSLNSEKVSNKFKLPICIYFKLITSFLHLK